MSDSGDDWEKQLEDEEALDKNISQADKKKGTFKDEDAVDSDEERKKRAEDQKKAEATAKADAKKKVKQGQKDYDKMFEERMKANKPSAAALQARIEQIEKSGLSAEAKAQQLQIAADMDITESLFADLEVNSKSLNLEKDYISFGKKVSATLYEG